MDQKGKSLMEVSVSGLGHRGRRGGGGAARHRPAGDRQPQRVADGERRHHHRQDRRWLRAQRDREQGELKDRIPRVANLSMTFLGLADGDSEDVHSGGQGADEGEDRPSGGGDRRQSRAGLRNRRQGPDLSTTV